MNQLWMSALLTGALVGQQADLSSRLVARGAPPDFARQVAQAATAARAEGLPVEPIADKAFEGLAKGYAPDRILPVVRGLVDRLREGRAVAISAGIPRPPGAVVAAAAEALGRGIDRGDIQGVLLASRMPGAGGVGLTVASSLVAQGIGPRDATHAVEVAYRDGHSAQELLELPSVTSSWLAEGVQLPEVLKRIQEGRGFPFPAGRGAAGALKSGVPPGLNAGKGPPINPPGKSGTRPHRP